MTNPWRKVVKAESQQLVYTHAAESVFRLVGTCHLSVKPHRHLNRQQNQARSARATDQGQRGLTGKWPALFFVFWSPLEAVSVTACPGTPCGGPACPSLFLAAAPGMTAFHICWLSHGQSLELQIIANALNMGYGSLCTDTGN